MTDSDFRDRKTLGAALRNEHVFRFNRRFYPMTCFNSLLGLSSRTIPPTYAGLYSGEWKHPIQPLSMVCWSFLKEDYSLFRAGMCAHA